MHSKYEERLPIASHNDIDLEDHHDGKKSVSFFQWGLEIYEDCQNYNPVGSSLCRECNVVEKLHPATEGIIKEYNKNPEGQLQKKLPVTCTEYKGGHKRLCGNCNWVENEHVSEKKSSREHIPTNAFGKLKLQGNQTQVRAKYVRVGDFTDPLMILNMMKKDWELQQVPNLVVSITGGATDFQINKNLHDELKRGLRKIATKTHSWIITGGTDTGVMKFVGKALENEPYGKVQLLGVATWGVISGREVLIDRGDLVQYPPDGHKLTTGDTLLDKNHTHFILVDGGKVREFGQEIKLRAELEQEIMKWQIDSALKKIPVPDGGVDTRKIDKHFAPAIQIVIEGGPNTIKQVLSSLNSCSDNPVKDNSDNLIMPVVVVKGSGRAADILSYAYTLDLSEGNAHTDAGAKDELRLRKNIMLRMPGMTVAQQLSIFHNVKLCMDKKEYITIYDPSKDGDFDEAVLLALMRVNSHDEDKNVLSIISQLELAMSWNRADIAKKYLFTDNIETNHNSSLEDIMMDALSGGKHEFVKLLLDNGFDINRFLDYGRLSVLYLETFVPVESVSKFIFVKNNKGSIIEDINSQIMQRRERNTRGLKLKCVHGGLLKLIGMDVVPHYKNEYTFKKTFAHPFNELFIWAVYRNFHELALLLWRLDDESLAKALVARKLYIRLAEKYKKYHHLVEEAVINSWIANAEEFGKLAVALLEECALKDKVATETLLQYQLKRWGKQDCMSLAASSQLEEFIAHYACQEVLSKRWKGYLSFRGNNETMQVWSGMICFPAVSHIVKYHPSSKENQFHDQISITQQQGKSLREKIKMISEFYAAPVTSFWLNFIFYLIFLLLFCNFVTKKLPDRPSTVEWIVLVFLISLGTEEIRQVCHVPHCVHSWHKVKVWWSMHWNKSDIVGVSVFFLAFALRLTTSSGLKKIAHIVYALDIMIWIVRLLDICAISKTLGPYVVMVQRMTVDVIYFLIILSVFLLSYGVARYAILLPQDDFSWSSIRHMITIPYFEMYGEVFFEAAAKQNETVFGTRHGAHSFYAQPIVLFILGVYLILTNILLINLLIAIFNNTYNTVQINSERIWRFQRYYLVDEYHRRPAIPIPFIIISHFILLVKWLLSKCKKTKNIPNENEEEDESSEFYELLRLEQDAMSCFLEKREKQFHENPEKKLDYIQARGDQLEELLKNTKEELAAIKKKLFKSTTQVDMRLVRMENTLVATKKAATRLPSKNKSKSSNAMLTKRMQKQLHLLDMKTHEELNQENVDGPNSPRSPSISEEEPSFNISARPSLPTLKQEESIEKCHILSRCLRYPSSEIERFTFPDQFVSWKVPFPSYKPRSYVAPNVLPGLAWVDKEFDVNNPPKFNEIDGEVDRTSFEGVYSIDEETGLPLNPAGRTGLIGRGLYRRYGPNHITEAIFTRFKDQLEQQKSKPEMEVLVIEKNTGECYLPSDEVKQSTKVKDRLPRILLQLFNSKTLKEHGVNRFSYLGTMAALDAVIRNRTEVFRGYLDDKRNTDNAWVETAVYNYISDYSGHMLTAFFIPEERANKLRLKWVDLNENTPLMDDRIWYLEFVAKKHGAYFSENDDD
ncbi:transient receptor potential cation channel subfamily M member 7-like isoform X1 [Hydractinia symbiolongicarpus]|uniref:transient receptor potential cation channel subfamily M member 7-like isoform X1 n=1 Tax=Hydractinia symbiolongicarpus TaxID=13093 RepID=UPI00254A3B78|nr:transient receptor potential cation channel subfamily M member 7-like isoform X1 [Hydractinia symbiolongicarpus]